MKLLLSFSICHLYVCGVVVCCCAVAPAPILAEFGSQICLGWMSGGVINSADSHVGLSHFVFS